MKSKPLSISMFPQGDDLPLFSGTPITVHIRPFVAKEVHRQNTLFDIRPRFDNEKAPTAAAVEAVSNPPKEVT